MSIPINARGKHKTRQRMFIIAECYKSDYKAESCSYRPCEECHCAEAISSLEPLSASRVESVEEFLDCLKTIERPPIKKRKKAKSAKKKRRKTNT